MKGREHFPCVHYHSLARGAPPSQASPQPPADAPTKPRTSRKSDIQDYCRTRNGYISRTWFQAYLNIWMAERLLLLEAAGSEVQPANLHKSKFLSQAFSQIDASECVKMLLLMRASVRVAHGLTGSIGSYRHSRWVRNSGHGVNTVWARRRPFVIDVRETRDNRNR